jgi:hypothetical protein
MAAPRADAGRPRAADYQASLSGLDRNSFQSQPRRTRQLDARFHGDLRFVFAPPCSTLSQFFDLAIAKNEITKIAEEPV